MKFIWEPSDIVAGTRAVDFVQKEFVICAVDTKDQKNVGFSILDTKSWHVGDVMNAANVCKMFNEYEYIPVFGTKS